MFVFFIPPNPRIYTGGSLRDRQIIPFSLPAPQDGLAVPAQLFFETSLNQSRVRVLLARIVPSNIIALKHIYTIIENDICVSNYLKIK